MTVMLGLQCNCDLISYMSSRTIPAVALAQGCSVMTQYTPVAVAFLLPSIFRRGFLTSGGYQTPVWVCSAIRLILADMDAGGG